MRQKEIGREMRERETKRKKENQTKTMQDSERE